MEYSRTAYQDASDSFVRLNQESQELKRRLAVPSAPRRRQHVSQENQELKRRLAVPSAPRQRQHVNQENQDLKNRLAVPLAPRRRQHSYRHLPDQHQDIRGLGGETAQRSPYQGAGPSPPLNTLPALTLPKHGDG